MTLSSRVRRTALVAHVATSVGWLGAVAAFLVLSVVGLRSSNAEVVRACYLAMDLLGRYLIVPISLLALSTGLIQPFGTTWGLFRYYWVAIKFVLTVGATGLLLLHQYNAVAAAASLVLGPADARQAIASSGLGYQLTLDAVLAIVVLMAATTLSIVKPWGLISKGENSPARYVDVAIGILIIVFMINHLAGGGMAHQQ